MPLESVPPLPQEVGLTHTEREFGYRGRIGCFVLPPSQVGIFEDSIVHCDIGVEPAEATGTPAPGGAIKIRYDKRPGLTFCGAYVMILGDLSTYQTLTFMIKGERGGEIFEIGMNDLIANRREDAVFIGSINRFLPSGVTTEWQEVRIPLSDFYGARLDQVMSLVFSFNDEGSGAFWIDQLRFHTEELVSREETVIQQGVLRLDDFDHSDMNLLGKKANAFKRLPSVCVVKRVAEGAYGGQGRSLQLAYHKESSGWCGYYTLLNFIDGPYYNLGAYRSVSFWVRGERGGETFEIGMADENWMTIGDSLKAGPIEKYLPGGVTTEWQRVEIPLKDFGALDLGRMGSFVINFSKKGDGVVYLDDPTFHLMTEEEMLKAWEEGS